MARYEERKTVLKAVTVPSVIANITSEFTPPYPDWVKSHYDLGNLAVQINGNLVVTTVQGKRIAGNSDMLIQDMVGDLSLMPATKFNNLYKPIGDN